MTLAASLKHQIKESLKAHLKEHKEQLKEHIKARIEEQVQANLRSWMEPRAESKTDARDTDARASEVKGRILDVARDQFMRLGFNSVTMDEIAAESGVSKKTLYQYFPSKDALVSEVARANMEKCNAELRAILRDSESSPTMRLRRMMDYVAGIYGELSVSLVHDMRRCAPAIWQEVEAGRQRLIEEDFSALLKEGRAKGDFRKDIDTPVFLLIYAEVVRHVLNPATFGRLKIAPTRIFEATCKVLFEGLLTEKAREEYHETP